ncbi:HAD family hydrolase [Levilactobacillus namurensis]|uniref:Capsular biosynthesis protein n=1 Tax=Levilactobacillus namurensis TaxID=380393 RepID=A0AAW8W7S0_9LACO|nr:capsular biosynthesis protein [Levilactobacillus namurensis]MDT7014793.1 capsular biosynthesis protein [Levilactobacillus namurensis]
MEKQRRLLIEITKTLCGLPDSQGYLDGAPQPAVVTRLRQYQAAGYQVVLFTSRQMQTSDGNLERLNRYTARNTMKWLRRHQVPYDRLLFGKPWAGQGDYDIDDRVLHPGEFLQKTPAELLQLVAQRRQAVGAGL